MQTLSDPKYSVTPKTHRSDPKRGSLFRLHTPQLGSHFLTYRRLDLRELEILCRFLTISSKDDDFCYFFYCNQATSEKGFYSFL